MDCDLVAGELEPELPDYASRQSGRQAKSGTGSGFALGTVLIAGHCNPWAKRPDCIGREPD